MRLAPNGTLWRRSARAGIGWALALAPALVACGGSGEAEPAGDDAATLAQIQQPIIGGALDESTSGVVGLALDLGSRVAGHCSGTLIAPNLVLTARHCVALTEATDAEGVVECGTAKFKSSFPARMLLASPEPVRPGSRGEGLLTPHPAAQPSF